MEGAELPVKADLPGSPDTRERVHTEALLGSGSSSMWAHLWNGRVGEEELSEETVISAWHPYTQKTGRWKIAGKLGKINKTPGNKRCQSYKVLKFY